MLEKDKLNIERIIYSINKIDEYGTDIDSVSELYEDTKTFDAIITQLINIGECASKISEETKHDHPDIEWHRIIGMRNIIAHNYFGIDARIIWKTMKESLPNLKSTLV